MPELVSTRAFIRVLRSPPRVSRCAATGTALVLASWLLAVGCTSPLRAVEPSGDVVVTERDAGGEVGITRGATLIVRLSAQLGTGYSWQISENDPSHLRLLGPPSLERSGNDQPGATQEQVFRFVAEKPGTTPLMLRYRRPWEPDAPPARTFSVHVRIR